MHRAVAVANQITRGNKVQPLQLTTLFRLRLSEIPNHHDASACLSIQTTTFPRGDCSEDHGDMQSSGTRTRKKMISSKPAILLIPGRWMKRGT